jgi:hypothetical protein
MIDVVENNRLCHDDTRTANECNVAYGHYRDYPPCYPTFCSDAGVEKFRIALLCQFQSRELVREGEVVRVERFPRRDCIPLEEGKLYKWSTARLPPEKYPYSLYEDFDAAMFIVTPQGKALYATRVLDSIR